MDALELHIRTTLRQSDFSYIRPDRVITIHSDGRVEDSRDDEEWNRPDHLRLNFDSRDDPDIDKANRELLELFNTDFKRYRVVLKSYKGVIEAIIVRRSDYNTINYWDIPHSCYENIDDDLFPFVMYINDLNNYGTVGIIRRLIVILKELGATYLNVPSYNKQFALSLGAKWDSMDELCYIPHVCENRNILLSHFTISK